MPSTLIRQTILRGGLRKAAFAWMLSASLLVAAATASSTSTPPPKTCDSCSDALDLQRRVSRAISKDDGVSLTEEGRSLRATLEDVLSEADCRFLVNHLPPEVFVDAGGYESTSNQYTASRKGYSGIGLAELAASGGASSSSSSGNARRSVFSSAGDYDKFLEFRERVRASTERALNLCPGTLKIDYTHISQKTPGGTHRPHADNCFHYYRPIGEAGGRDNDSDNDDAVAATVDATKRHPYSQRVAASILYLNDDGFGGGEFYWASRSSQAGTPETIVAPKTGRMTVFTSGIENLHGALPVTADPVTENDGNGDGNGDADAPRTPRRLALAMWYVTDPAHEETVPEYGREPTGEDDADADPNRTVLFEIPVESLRVGGLRLALGLYLVGKQNTPARGSWRANQHNDRTLHAVFADQTAMLSIVLGDRSIVVGRHTDGVRPPSLRYQLQESVLLHGVLDELTALAEEDQEGRSADDRLVRLDPAAIDRARDTLPTKR